MIRNVTLWLGIVATLVALAGCRSTRDETAAPVSTRTPEVASRQTLNLLVPEDTLTLFSGLALLAENAGLPYKTVLYEVVSIDAGIQAVIDGQADMMFVTRQLHPDEPLVFFELIFSPVTIFVNPGAGVSNLTSAQVAAIFSGEVVNWSYVGGPDLAITVFVQQDDDLTTHAIRDHILEGRAFTSSAQRLLNDHDVLTMVGGLPGAIGYTAWAFRALVEQDMPSTYLPALSLDGRGPDDPEYPMWSAVGFVFRPEQQDKLQPVLDWIAGLLTSDMGQTMSQQFGFRLSDSMLQEPGEK